MPADNESADARKTLVVIDDFEGPIYRTSLDTLRVGDFDMGKSRSRQVMQTRWENKARGYVLNLSGELIHRDDPYIGVALPFFRGSVTPADISSWDGIQADLRGTPGEVQMILTTGSGMWTHNVDVTSDWQTFQVPYNQLSDQSALAWQGTDAVDIRFRVSGAGGSTVWLDIDAVRFY